MAIPLEVRAVFTQRAGKKKKICRLKAALPSTSYVVIAEFSGVWPNETGRWAVVAKDIDHFEIYTESAPSTDRDFSVHIYHDAQTFEEV